MTSDDFLEVKNMLEDEAKEIDFYETVSFRKDGTPILKFSWVKLSEHVQKLKHFINIRETDTLYMFEEGVYIPALTYVEEICKQLTNNKIKITESKEVINTLKYTNGINEKDLEKYDNYLCLENGLFNTETYNFIPHDPKIILLEKLPVFYDEKIKPNKFLEFINSSLEGQEEDITLIKQFFASCLVRHYRTQKALIVIGEQGTGKSTLIDTIKTLLGQDNISGVSIQNLGEQFSTAKLYRKLANINDDISDRGLYDTSLFKQVTGGSFLDARKMFTQNGLKFVNHAKLIYTANTLPSTPDDSDAFFVRVEIVKFNKTFRGTKNEDKNLTKKLTTKESITGLFNWLVEGLKELESNDWKFEIRNSIEEIRQQYKINSNPLTSFIETQCEISDDNEIKVNDFYQAYKNYCIENKQKPFDLKVFGREISRLRLPIYRKRIRDSEGQNRFYVYEGIELLSNLSPLSLTKPIVSNFLEMKNINALENVRDNRDKDYSIVEAFIMSNYQLYEKEDLILSGLKSFKNFSWLDFESCYNSMIENGVIPNITRLRGVQ